MRLQWTSQSLAQWYESLGIITAIAPKVSAGLQDEMGKAIPAHVHISRATDRDLGMGLRGGAATPSQALDRNRRHLSAARRRSRAPVPSAPAQKSLFRKR